MFIQRPNGHGLGRHDWLGKGTFTNMIASEEAFGSLLVRRFGERNTFFLVWAVYNTLDELAC